MYLAESSRQYLMPGTSVFSNYIVGIDIYCLGQSEIHMLEDSVKFS